MTTKKEEKRILILGAGFGGLTCANLLRKNLSRQHRITIIDKNTHFIMGIVNLWILNGSRTLQESRIDLKRLENKGIEFLNEEIINIDTSKKLVRTNLNKELVYDYLIISLGAEYQLAQIQGFSHNGGFNLYDSEEIPKLRTEILCLKKGRITICITNIPYKCPPAPYEASLLINDILIKNGTRSSIEVDIYTPTPIALPVAGPKTSQDIVSLLSNHSINFHPLHKLKKVTDDHILEFENGNKINYDLLIGIPPHKVPTAIRNSGLLKENESWINVDKFTLRTPHENVFAIGDVTEIKVNPTSTIPKAGIFAEGQAKIVSQQIIDEINSNRSTNNPRFDGKGFCFMEVGNKNAGYISADFYNVDGPLTSFETPSEKSFKNKIDFVESRIYDWLLNV